MIIQNFRMRLPIKFNNCIVKIKLSMVNIMKTIYHSTNSKINIEFFKISREIRFRRVRPIQNSRHFFSTQYKYKYCRIEWRRYHRRSNYRPRTRRWRGGTWKAYWKSYRPGAEPEARRRRRRARRTARQPPPNWGNWWGHRP